MVSLSLGARWQEKVTEVANLKLEKQELLSSLSAVREECEALRKALETAEKSSEEVRERLQELALREGNAECARKGQEQSVASLYAQLAEKSKRVSELETSTRSLQTTVDDLSSSLQSARTLTARLQTEISQGDAARVRIETERDAWKSQCERKSHDLELMTHAKEHCEKHVAILVKEKDRLLGKKTEVSPVLSQQYAQYEQDRPLTAVKPDSFNEVEILRQKKMIADLKSQSSQKDAELEKLKKENWALITRLRNARK